MGTVFITNPLHTKSHKITCTVDYSVSHRVMLTHNEKYCSTTGWLLVSDVHIAGASV